MTTQKIVHTSWCKGYMVPHSSAGFLWLQPNCSIFKKLVGCEVATDFQALFLLPWIKMQTARKRNLLSNSSERPLDRESLGLVPLTEISKVALADCLAVRSRYFPHCALLDNLVTLLPSLHYWLRQEFYFCVVLKPLKELPDSVRESSFMRSALSNSSHLIFKQSVPSVSISKPNLMHRKKKKSFPITLYIVKRKWVLKKIFNWL